MLKARPASSVAALVLAAAWTWGISPAAAAAGPGQGQLIVGATVKRHVSVQLDVPQSLTISKADIDRGFVDVAQPVRVTVKSNAPDGYTLLLQPEGELVRRAVLHGMADAAVVSDAGASLTRAAAGRGMWSDTVELRVRFELSAQARAGTHGWPLQISMVPR